jgi:KDO2-lipid IV(A) lauroyltransferase
MRDRVEHAALRSLLGALRVPDLRGGQRLGERLGRGVDTVSRVRRAQALDNLRHAFPELPEAERREILRRMWVGLGRTAAEFARFDQRRPFDIRDLMDLENAGAFAQARERGKGALLLTAHFGNWEVLGAAVSASGYPVTVLGARQRNPLVEDLLARYRARVGLPGITVGESLRPLVRAFRNGAFVATLADQDGGRHGFFVDFLGRPASVQAGLFRLIARRGVPLVTGFAVRDGARWRGEFQAPEWPRPVSGEAQADAEALRLARVYTARVETYVRRHPDHWFWLHRRWKTRPPAAPEAASREVGLNPDAAGADTS